MFLSQNLIILHEFFKQTLQRSLHCNVMKKRRKTKPKSECQRHSLRCDATVTKCWQVIWLDPPTESTQTLHSYQLYIMLWKKWCQPNASWHFLTEHTARQWGDTAAVERRKVRHVGRHSERHTGFVIRARDVPDIRRGSRNGSRNQKKQVFVTDNRLYRCALCLSGASIPWGERGTMLQEIKGEIKIRDQPINIQNLVSWVSGKSFKLLPPYVTF